MHKGVAQTFLWPRCYICNKPVDNFTQEQDMRTLSFVFIAICHGETEFFIMEDVVSRNFNLSSVKDSVAFCPENEVKRVDNI